MVAFKRLKITLIALILLGLGRNNAFSQVVEFVTEAGRIKVKLYKDTPGHTANFIKNVKDGTYNGVLFHRVINDFMIQGGDPESVKAKPGEVVGYDKSKFEQPAEILPNHFHKRGALAAARQPDATNPEKKSSQYQFYIVVGRDYTRSMLKTLEKNQNRQKRFKVADSLLLNENNLVTKNQLDSLMKAKDYKTADKILDQMETKCDSIIGKNKLTHFSEEQIAEYVNSGGVPNLDGKYTVFGEVIEGLDIVFLIAQYPVDANSRPLTDVHVLKATVIEE